MNSGVLWFDGSTKSLNTKVMDAINEYRKRLGCEPKKVLCNPRELTQIFMVEKIVVEADPRVVQNHYYVI